MTVLLSDLFTSLMDDVETNVAANLAEVLMRHGFKEADARKLAQSYRDAGMYALKCAVVDLDSEGGAA